MQLFLIVKNTDLMFDKQNDFIIRMHACSVCIPMQLAA